MQKLAVALLNLKNRSVAIYALKEKRNVMLDYWVLRITTVAAISFATCVATRVLFVAIKTLLVVKIAC